MQKRSRLGQEVACKQGLRATSGEGGWRSSWREGRTGWLGHFLMFPAEPWRFCRAPQSLCSDEGQEGGQQDRAVSFSRTTPRLESRARLARLQLS